MNAAQPQVTSLGTLTSLALSGPLTTTSTVSISNATASTSTGTGALVISNGGGLGVSGNLYAASIYMGSDLIATQNHVSSLYLTSANAAATYEVKLTAGTGLSRTGATLSVNAAQPQVTSLGTLTSLTLAGPLTSTSTVSLTNATASTSTGSGALVISNGGGLGVSGNLYAANIYMGTDLVSTQNWVTGLGYITTATATATFEVKLTAGTGLTRTGATLSVNAAQPGITSVGTLTGLALSGPATSTSTLTVNNSTASTSTTTGAIIIGGTGGLGVGGNVYAGNMFLGGAQVATQAHVASLYEVKLTAGTGLTRTGATLSVNAAQPGITSVGTLTSLSLSGALTSSLTTDSTAIGVGSAILQGGMSVAMNITTGSLTLASGLAMSGFSNGSWINLPTTGPSGIGTGGAGVNCFIGYCQTAGHWMTNSTPGDVAYRNAGGRILWGNTSGDAGMALVGDNLGIGTAAPTARLDVAGSAVVSGTLNTGTTMGTATISAGPSMIMSDGYDAAATTHTIAFLTTAQTGAGYIFVYARNANASTVGCMIVSFYKAAGGNIVPLAISTSRPTSLSTFTVAAAGNNVTVNTSPASSIAYTINFGS